jgi:hypothetical protein
MGHIASLIKIFREAEPRGLGLAPETKPFMKESAFNQDIPIIYSAFLTPRLA